MTAEPFQTIKSLASESVRHHVSMQALAVNWTSEELGSALWKILRLKTVLHPWRTVFTILTDRSE